jgi:hypothetical protein
MSSAPIDTYRRAAASCAHTGLSSKPAHTGWWSLLVASAALSYAVWWIFVSAPGSDVKRIRSQYDGTLLRLYRRPWRDEHDQLDGRPMEAESRPPDESNQTRDRRSVVVLYSSRKPQTGDRQTERRRARTAASAAACSASASSASASGESGEVAGRASLWGEPGDAAVCPLTWAQGASRPPAVPSFKLFSFLVMPSSALPAAAAHSILRAKRTTQIPCIDVWKKHPPPYRVYCPK